MPSYPTAVYTITKAYAFLVASKEGLKPLGHGGNRRGAQWTGNREVDGKEVLSLRLHKDRDTVNTYLRYGKWLTDETFEALIEGEADRSFFEIIQPGKTRMVKTLKGKRQQGSEIAGAVSSLVLKWFGEYDDGEGKPDLPLTSSRKKTARAVESQKGAKAAAASATVPENDSAVTDDVAPPTIGKKLIAAGNALIESGTRILGGLAGADLEAELNALQAQWEQTGHEIERALTLLKEQLAA
jgi:hypothetical protein